MTARESAGDRTGVWLVGARGSVATTTVVGALAMGAGLAGGGGMVTALEPFARCGLPPVGQLVFGGHDTAVTPWVKKAEALAAGGVLPTRLVVAVGADLEAAEGELRAAPSSGDPGRDADQVVEELLSFRERNGLARVVVVVHVASTEALAAPHPAHDSEAALARALAAGEPVLPPSSVYAWAAVQAGCAYVDFTPSTGARLAALEQAARRAGVPVAGRDGKTGETLVKSVLAPMMARRNLRVTSWSSLNLLGGGDGATLAQPAANAAKTASKARVLAQTLGYEPESLVRIDQVQQLGDGKTAWDLVTFTGFLGVGMRLDFTWQGVDSALAAPLVLDLARLVARAHKAGLCGPLADLAFFFKDPAEGAPHDLDSQWQRLLAFAAALSTTPALAA